MFISLTCLVVSSFLPTVTLEHVRKQPGDRCTYDEQCDGLHTLCLKRVCTCPSEFEDHHAGNNVRVCRQAPRRVNATCESNCQPPLVCQNGKCACWKAKQVGDQCVLECPAGQIQVGQSCKPASSALNGRCSEDSDCHLPFSICGKERCVCVPGAKATATGCVAPCPDGSTPGRSCSLKYLNDDSLRDSSEQMDTCPRGQRCVTWGKPDIGHCCKAYCPYGEADLTRSCRQSDIIQTPNQACPESTTHYCQDIESSGAVDRICCPRPCRDPTPLFWNGACLPHGHLEDPCEVDEQCEGGAAMFCDQAKRCQCRRGFSKHNSDKFPTCVRTDCPSGTVVVQGHCLPKAAVGGQCVDNAQCPANMQCMDGLCACPPGFAYNLGVCYNPKDPFNATGILCKLQAVIRPQQKPPQCANINS